MKEAPLTQQKTPAFICYKDVVSLMEKQHMGEWSINGVPGYLSNAQDDHRNTDYNLGETTTPKSTLWEELLKVKPSSQHLLSQHFCGHRTYSTNKTNKSACSQGTYLLVNVRQITKSIKTLKIKNRAKGRPLWPSNIQRPNKGGWEIAREEKENQVNMVLNGD